MGTLSLRLRLVFEDRSILSKTQRSIGMDRSWFLLKLQQHRTISDVCTHLLHIFNLHRSCPNGILLAMDGFALPPFESIEILKEKEIICVKKKGGSTPDARNLLDDVLAQGDDGLLLLANDNINKGMEEYQSESEEVDEEQQDEELHEEPISKKRKASTNLQNLKKRKRCLVAAGDDEVEAEPEETEVVNNDASHPMKISSQAKTNKIAAASNKKVKSPSIVKRSEELQENVEEANQASNAPGSKKISRSSRRKKFQRKKKRELAKITTTKPQTRNSKREITKLKNKETDGQPKGLLYWKQASKNPEQNGDVGPTVTRPGHVRFESADEDEVAVAEQTGGSTERIHRNGSSGKKKGHKWSREKFSTFRKNDHYKRINIEAFKRLFKDSKVPVIDPDDFDKLPPCSEPKEGDVIAYRLLELNSSWIPEFSSFRVGRISYYDAKDIVLIPVTEYPIVLEKINVEGLNDSPYGEDGTLEINYSALVDVRNVKQYDPDATEPFSNGVNPTPISDDKDAAENMVSNSNENIIDVPKDSNPGEASSWDRFSFKNVEIPEPGNLSTVDYGVNRSSYGGGAVNPSSYGGAGPSSSTNPDANKAESSEVKEGREGDPIDPWLNALKTASTQPDCENGSSWGKPWSSFVVTKNISVIPQKEDNGWHAGSSRGSWKSSPRGAPRGGGHGRGGGRGRGRGRFGN